MRLAKLKQHLENVHPQHINKDKTYFKHQRRALKSMKLDASSDFFRKNNQLFENGWHSARKRGRKKLATILLSNNTIQRQIKDLSLDIKSQLVQEIKTTPFGLFCNPTG